LIFRGDINPEQTGGSGRQKKRPKGGGGGGAKRWQKKEPSPTSNQINFGVCGTIPAEKTGLKSGGPANPKRAGAGVRQQVVAHASRGPPALGGTEAIAKWGISETPPIGGGRRFHRLAGKRVRLHDSGIFELARVGAKQELWRFKFPPFFQGGQIFPPKG